MGKSYRLFLGSVLLISAAQASAQESQPMGLADTDSATQLRKASCELRKKQIDDQFQATPKVLADNIRAVFAGLTQDEKARLNRKWKKYKEDLDFYQHEKYEVGILKSQCDEKAQEAAALYTVDRAKYKSAITELEHNRECEHKLKTDQEILGSYERLEKQEKEDLQSSLEYYFNPDQTGARWDRMRMNSANVANVRLPKDKDGDPAHDFFLAAYVDDYDGIIIQLDDKVSDVVAHGSFVKNQIYVDSNSNDTSWDILSKDCQAVIPKPASDSRSKYQELGAMDLPAVSTAQSAGAPVAQPPLTPAGSLVGTAAAQ